MKSSAPKVATASQVNQQIWEYYKTHKRDFPWRETTNPYYILVSEIMLQQTQTSRVVDYYRRFIRKFPSVLSLATCSQTELLQLWQGLGYNRRALFLKRAAEQITSEFHGVVPSKLTDLTKLPGVGANTAGAVLAYAFNQKVVFIETNIRKTITYFYFKNQEVVSDTEIAKKIKILLKNERSIREWYWAVVDYGAMLGRLKIITNNRSAHYVRQSKFEGSFRQIRAAVLRAVLDNSPITLGRLLQLLPFTENQLSKALSQLIVEGFLSEEAGKFVISD